jgi:flagellar biosynthesis anti-sigma factor FlgM
MPLDGPEEVGMKIEGRPGTATERLAPRRDGAGERVRAGREPGSDSVRIDLSPAARGLRELVGAVGDVRSIDPERVAELRSRIAAGTFSPDDEAVATALLREIAADE